jgi:hypothetical protein
MDPELQQRLTTLEQKIDATFASAEKTRKYFKWTLIITLVVTILPLIGLLFAIPAFISSFTGTYQGLL